MWQLSPRSWACFMGWSEPNICTINRHDFGPISFSQTVSNHKVGHTFAPNFFLASLPRVFSNSVVPKSDLDRSSLCTIVSGGEANVPETGRALHKALERLSAQRFCIKPAFGTIETCGGRIYSDIFPDHDLKQQYDFTSMGKCINGVEMRVVSDEGTILGPDAGSTAIGNLELKGNIVFGTYFNKLEATMDSFSSDAWVQTGDQGLIDGAGQLYLIGRAKELLIINVVNHSSFMIEATLEIIEGIVPCYTLILPYRRSGASTESLCVVCNPAYPVDDTGSRVAANNAISSAVLLQVGIRPLIILLNKKILQKTNAGPNPSWQDPKGF